MTAFDPDRWQALSPYLDEALEIADADARVAWLVSLRHEEPVVAAELDSLLSEHRALACDGFLERAPVEFPVQSITAGQTIGTYTLMSPIGQGGMGSVWLAERSDGRFDRRAAIKFLSVALAGRGEERFRREGSILARLTHPQIAQLVDAGVSSAGQPYLILEHVEGEHIDQYCDHHGLAVESRIGLFLEVLAAVEHAHAHLIVHRDLKPSNVLVGTDGHVKLLDFGIAKLLEEDGLTGAATRLTREGGAMTPEYAAPEQVTSAPITTATDVYALGVLLYVLLTGRHPAAGAMPSHAELVKALVDIEPVRMSDAMPRTDKRRRLLRGDLDTIVRKALKKHPAERYASVSAMADDLRRYQRHEPIRARPDTMAYRAAKFVRRNRLSSAAVVLTVAGLSLGLYVANHERVIAEQRFRQLRQLSGKVFELDSAIRNLPGSTQARQRLVSASLEYLGGLASSAPRDPDLAEEISNGYWRVAGAQGVPTQLNLGDFAKADQNLQKADALLETVLAARPDRRTALLSSATIAQDRMIIAESEHRDADALTHARKAAARLEDLQRQGLSESERDRIAGIYGNVALASSNLRLYENAFRYARRSVEIARANPPIASRISAGLSLVANALRLEGDLEGALRAIREAREVSEHTSYPNQTTRMIDVYGLLLREGLIEGEDGGVSLGRPAEAIDALQRAFDLTESVARTDPLDFTSRSRVGTSGRELGKILRQRDPERALAVFDVSIKRQGEIRNNLKARRDRSVLLAYSSYPLHRLHRAIEAKQRIDAALAILKETGDYPVERITLGSEVDTALRALADHEAEEGHLATAIEGYEQLLDKVMLAKPDTLNDLRDANRLALLEQALADLYRRTGDSVKADALDAKRLDLWRHWDRKLPNHPFVLRQLAQ
jgi:serine/threonine-protein kinase